MWLSNLNAHSHSHIFPTCKFFSSHFKYCLWHFVMQGLLQAALSGMPGEGGIKDSFHITFRQAELYCCPSCSLGAGVPCSSCLGCLLKTPVRQWYIGVPEQALLDSFCICQRLTELSLASLSFWHRRNCDRVVCALLPRPQVSRRHLRSTLPISALLRASMPGKLDREMPSSLDDGKGGMT
jgi:hypothetical protein